MICGFVVVTYFLLREDDNPPSIASDSTLSGHDSDHGDTAGHPETLSGRNGTMVAHGNDADDVQGTGNADHTPKHVP